MHKVFVIAGSVLVWASSALAQPAQLPVSPFNAAQVDAGRTAFIQHCMMCHGDKLQGIGDAQVLVGQIFVDAWGKNSVKDLYTSVRLEMPFDDPASLSDEMYLNIVAFMLHANGAKSGTTPLPPDSSVKIGAIVTGDPAPDVAAGLKSAK